jgi:hypothetical protein
MQAGGAVDGVLQHRQAGERLHAGEEDPTVFEPVFVFERHICEIQSAFPFVLVRTHGRCPSQVRSMPDRDAHHPACWRGVRELCVVVHHHVLWRVEIL